MKQETEQAQAVVYCRVSSTKQTTKGDGLGSQETRCREYATYKGYEVAEVFKDDVSGSLVSRPGMKSMLAYLRKRKADGLVVIIDDISRLARGLEAHIQLRSAIGSVGARLESPSIEFGEDSDSQLVENLLASVSQHQRQKNGEQVKNRMRARAQNGYWVFQAPIGYRYEKASGHGKIIVRDEPLVSLVAEALEGFASGRFESAAEMGRFLESHPIYPRGTDGYVHRQRLVEMLNKPLYAGYIDLPNWDVRLVEGKHEALISFQTYQRIQERLKGDAKAPARVDIREDFPLRGFVTCGCCGAPLTAGWTKGRNAKYPYYYCYARSCEAYGKAIKRDVLEGEFQTLLEQMQPSKSLFQIVYKFLRDLWDRRHKAAKEEAVAMRGELLQIENKVGQLLDRAVSAESDTLVSVYEGRIHQLESRKIALREHLAENGRPLKGFDEAFRTAMIFLANPRKLWLSGSFEARRAVLKLMFAERLAYVRNEGLRTASLTLPFKALADMRDPGLGMVGPAGLEPATRPL